MSSDRGLRRIDKRNNERVEIWGSSVTITYPRGRKTTEEETTTINISSNGVAIYSDREFEEGTEIKVKGGGVWSDARKGTVVWCKKLDKGLYKVGIKVT